MAPNWLSGVFTAGCLSFTPSRGALSLKNSALHPCIYTDRPGYPHRLLNMLTRKSKEQSISHCMQNLWNCRHFCGALTSITSYTRSNFNMVNCWVLFPDFCPQDVKFSRSGTVGWVIGMRPILSYSYAMLFESEPNLKFWYVTTWTWDSTLYFQLHHKWNAAERFL